MSFSLSLSLSLLVFESQHKDCSFNTTGQQIVLISPGVGVFEVNNINMFVNITCIILLGGS